MQIQLNTDSNFQGGGSFSTWVESELKNKLQRFHHPITRVEVHMGDAAATRVGEADKRCKIEARLAGRQPVVVSHDAATARDAVHGAAEKLLHLIDSAQGRARDVHRHDSIRGAVHSAKGSED